MEFLQLKTNEATITTRPARSDDSWDRGNTRTTWNVNGVVLRPNVEGRSWLDNALPNTDDFKPGQVVYVLYAIYSTGDSFGSDEDRCLELYGFYSNVEYAQESYKALNSSTKYGDNIILNDKGKPIEVHCPWHGYFERLTGIHLESFVIQYVHS